MLEDEVVRLLQDYVAGQSVGQLTKRYQLHRTTVLEHLERGGLQRRPNVRKLTDAQVQCAAKLYASGSSLVSVAEHFGVNARTISREFEEAGVPVRARRGWPPASGGLV